MAWGSSRDGGNAPSGLTNCLTLFSNGQAFACLNTDGSVVSWRHYANGGTALSGRPNCKTLFSNGQNHNSSGIDKFC